MPGPSGTGRIRPRSMWERMKRYPIVAGPVTRVFDGTAPETHRIATRWAAGWAEALGRDMGAYEIHLDHDGLPPGWFRATLRRMEGL